MGPIGMQEMIFILILALLLFGPKKLPELARLLGKGMSEFRRAKNELKNTFDTHLQELEREARLEEARKNPPAIPSHTPYSYNADEYGHNASGYGYNGSAYPSEPAVESHAQPEPAALPAAPAVSGTVPRSPVSNPVPAPAVDHQPTNEEHPA
jgi:TatA/E family protein of Tat protein translocase